MEGNCAAGGKFAAGGNVKLRATRHIECAASDREVVDIRVVISVVEREIRVSR